MRRQSHAREPDEGRRQHLRTCNCLPMALAGVTSPARRIIFRCSTSCRSRVSTARPGSRSARVIGPGAQNRRRAERSPARDQSTMAMTAVVPALDSLSRPSSVGDDEASRPRQSWFSPLFGRRQDEPRFSACASPKRAGRSSSARRSSSATPPVCAPRAPRRRR